MKQQQRDNKKMKYTSDTSVTMIMFLWPFILIFHQVLKILLHQSTQAIKCQQL